MILSLCALLTAFQDPPPPEVVVTATRVERPAHAVGQTVTVITAEEIRRRQARDVLDLLRTVPGLAVTQSGHRGSTGALFVRGGESNHALVLLDGAQMNLGGGDFDWATLTADNVERIEILRGPGSALYGSDAVSAVVNIVSKKGTGRPRFNVSAMAGSFGTFEERFSASGGVDGFGWSASAGRWDSDGNRSLNSEADNTSFRGRLGWQALENLELGLTLGHIDHDVNFPTDFVFGVPGGFPAVDPHQGTEQEDWIAGLQVGWKPLDWWEHRLKLDHYDTESTFRDRFDPIPSDFADMTSVTGERRSSVDYRWLFHTEPWAGAVDTVTVGFELEGEHFDSDSRTSPPPTTTDFDESRRTIGVYLQNELAVDDRFFVTPGVRFDRNSEFGSTVNPRLALAYRILESDTRLHASIGTAFKEPTFIENFGIPGLVTGDPDLDPERSISWEVGVDQEFLDGDVTASFAYFSNRFKDLIAFLGTAPPVPAFGNIQEADARGVEFSFRVRPHELVSFGGGATYLRTRVLDGGGVGATDFVDGEELLRRPRMSGFFFVDVDWEDLEVNVSGSVVGTRIDRDFGVSFAGLRVHNPGYVKIDLAASYRILTIDDEGRDVRLKFLGQNLLDHEYEEALGFPALGMSLMGGFEVNF